MNLMMLKLQFCTLHFMHWSGKKNLHICTLNSVLKKGLAQKILWRFQQREYKTRHWNKRNCFKNGYFRSSPYCDFVKGKSLKRHIIKYRENYKSRTKNMLGHMLWQNHYNGIGMQFDNSLFLCVLMVLSELKKKSNSHFWLWGKRITKLNGAFKRLGLALGRRPIFSSVASLILQSTIFFNLLKTYLWFL